MRLVEIADRLITLELTPEDALRMARVCTRAVEHHLYPDDTDADCYEMLAVGFDAMALAAVQRSYVSERDAGQLTLSYQREWMLRPYTERPEPPE